MSGFVPGWWQFACGPHLAYGPDFGHALFTAFIKYLFEQYFERSFLALQLTCPLNLKIIIDFGLIHIHLKINLFIYIIN